MKNFNRRTAFKTYSIIIILMGILDIIQTVLSYYTMQEEQLAAVAENSATNTLFIVIIALSVVSLLVRIYIGAMGLAQLKGHEGRTHIILAKILCVLLAISCIPDIIGLIGGTAEFGDLISSLADLLFLFFFTSEAGKLLNGEF